MTTIVAALIVAGAVLAHGAMTADLASDASRSGVGAVLALLCWAGAAALYLGAS